MPTYEIGGNQYDVKKPDRYIIQESQRGSALSAFT